MLTVFEQQCDECLRVFDLLNQRDYEDLLMGHYCES